MSGALDEWLDRIGDEPLRPEAELVDALPCEPVRKERSSSVNSFVICCADSSTVPGEEISDTSVDSSSGGTR